MAATPELLDFVRQQFAAGASRETLRSVLSAQGWTTEDIDESMVRADPAAANSTVAAPVGPSGGPVMTTVLSAAQPSGFFAKRVVRILLVLVGVLCVAGLVAGTAYAYLQRLGPFNTPPYTEASLVSGVLQASRGVTSLTFTASTSVNVLPRESGEQPYVATTSASMVAAYSRDYDRAQNLSRLLSYLQSDVSRYSAPLATLAGSVSAAAQGISPVTARDPATEQPYAFTSTDNGKNFSLTAVFETPQAVAAIKASPLFSASTTAVHDLTITFTRGSSAWFLVQKAPPQPFFVTFQDMVGTTPPDAAVSLALSGASDRTLALPAAKALLSFAGRVSGSSAAFGVAFLQKDNRYYVRVNELSSEIKALVPIPTDLWIDITDSLSTSTVGAVLSNTGAVPPQTLDAGLAYAHESVAYHTYLAHVLDAFRTSNLIALVRPAYSERVSGELLYRYDLTIRKEAIVPFAEKLLALATTDLALSPLENAQGQKLITYLQSAEFADVFAYVQHHWQASLWVDAQGVPRMFDSKLTVVPSSTAPALADKEVVFETRLTSDNINKHPVIDAPATSTPLSAIRSQLEDGLSGAQNRGSDAAIQSYLATILTAGEIYYGEGNTYGSSGVGCLRAGNFFGGSKQAKEAVLALIQLAGDSNVRCVVGNAGQAHAESALLSTGTYWCTDSTGQSKMEAGPLGTKPVCL